MENKHFAALSDQEMQSIDGGSLGIVAQVLLYTKFPALRPVLSKQSVVCSVLDWIIR